MLGAFARLFSKRVWEHAKPLLLGAILCPAERTVTAALRVMGLSWEKHFQNYHRVLNRGPVILGLDDTIERRRRRSDQNQRDLPRSTSAFQPQSFCESQRLALAEWIWALPFLTVLAPSERYQNGKARKHKKLTV